jgi:HD-GYP domain-containing protein (c-di-GMP phosphodiesterase class II)
MRSVDMFSRLLFCRRKNVGRKREASRSLAQYVYKRQAVDDLVPGMILGKMLLTNDGKNFLNEGSVLTLHVIQTLQLWGFRYVEIREEARLEKAKADAPSTDAKAITETPPDLPAGFQAYYQAAVQILKQSLGRARFLKEGFEIEDISQMVSECVLPLIEDSAVMDNLQMMPHTEDYLYHHSVDVGVIAGCLATWLGYPFHDIEELILGGLLHDTGKALIPLKVLNKPGTLSEEEMNLVRFHSTRGYKFLKEKSSVSRNVLLCALQHHERMDGSGYPLAVLGEKIHPFAKIIAVADVFDAMTSPRGYGHRATPYEAAEIMKHEMYGKLDVQVCTIFLERVCQRFAGDVVQLNDGRSGEVIFLNEFDSTRPTIRTQDGEFIDLDKRRDLYICKMLHS